MTNLKRLHNKWHKELSQYWQERGMPNYCEIQLEKCINLYLSPSHSLKRRKITTREQYHEIAWACENCHRQMDEQMSPEEMMQTVQDAIARRSEW